MRINSSFFFFTFLGFVCLSAMSCSGKTQNGDGSAMTVDDTGSADDSDDDDLYNDDTGDDTHTQNEVLARITGGEPGHSGISMALGKDGETYILAVEGRALRLYTIRGNYTTAETVAPMAKYQALVIDGKGNLHVTWFDTQSNSVCYATNSGGLWTKEIIRTENHVETYNAIALDEDGNPYLAFWAMKNYEIWELFVAKKIADEWTFEGIDACMSGKSPISMLIDKEENIHIAFWNYGTWYLSNESGTWVKEEALPGDNPGDKSTISDHQMNVPISLDKNETVHLISARCEGDEYILYHASRLEDSWSLEIVDRRQEVIGRFLEMKADYEGYPHIVYPEYIWEGVDVYTNLYYATNASGSWTIESLWDDHGFLGIFPVLGLDASGAADIALLDATSWDLKYISNVSGEWKGRTLESAPDPGRWNYAIMDPKGYGHVFYSNQEGDSSYKYFHATNRSGSWNSEEVEIPTSLPFLLATDSDLNIHLIICDNEKHLLFYSNNVSGEWKTEKVTEIDEYESLDWSILQIDTHGEAHLVYDDSLTGTERHATNSSGTWTLEDIYPEYLLNKAMTVDAEHYVHLSLQDGSDLVYMTNAGGSWTSTTVDQNLSDWNPGLSIAVDCKGFAHMSYIGLKFKDDDTPYFPIQYATNKSGEWLIETVDDNRLSVHEGGQSSIAVDEGGAANIIYHRMNVDDLKVLRFATNFSGEWKSRDLDITDDPVCNPSLFFANGVMHAVYYGEFSLWYNRFKP